MRCHNGAMKEVKLLTEALHAAVESEAAMRRAGVLACEHERMTAFTRVVEIHEQIGRHLASTYLSKQPSTYSEHIAPEPIVGTQ